MTTWQNYLDMLVKTLCLDLRDLKLVEETKSGETQRTLKHDVILPTKAASLRYLWLNKDTQIHRERERERSYRRQTHFSLRSPSTTSSVPPFFELLTKLHDHTFHWVLTKRGVPFFNKMVFKRMHHHDNVVHGLRAASEIDTSRKVSAATLRSPLAIYPKQTCNRFIP